MKILYFRMKGYINILQGMGLDEIIIPFSEFKSRIILIQGANGTGKSTILRALSPEPDSSDSFRKDVYIENGVTKIICYPGEKEIHYTDGINIYKILFQHIPSSNKSSLTTKAFISKNDVELNPNGNVTSFRDIRNDIFDINPIFLDMSIITSDKRGIVDMTPANRRKYLSSFIGSVDTYNNMYKIFSKKASTCKSYINNLHMRISNIGDETNLRLLYSNTKQELDHLRKEKETNVKTVEEAEAVLSILDPDGKIYNLRQSLFDNVGLTKSKLTKITQQAVQLCTKLNLEPDREYSYYEDDYNKTLEAIKGYEETLNKYNSSLSAAMASKSSIESSKNNDISRLNGLSSTTVKENIKDTIKELKGDITVYSDIIKGIGIKDNNEIPSRDTIVQLHSVVSNFIDSMKVIMEQYSQDELELIVDIVTNNKQLSSLIQEVQIKIDHTSDFIIDTNDALSILYNDKKSIEMLNDRPEDCFIDSCPYIKKFLDIKNKYESLDNYDLDERIKDTKDSLEDSNAEKDIYINLLNTYCNIEEGINILSNSLSVLVSYKDIIIRIGIDFNKVFNIKNILLNHISIEYILKDLSELESATLLKMELESSQHELDLLEADYKAYINNENLIESLKRSIEDYNNKIEEEDKKVSKFLQEISSINTILEKFRSNKSDIESLLEILKEKDKLVSELADLKEKYEKAKVNIKTIEEKLNDRNDAMSSLDRIEDMITNTEEELNRLNYSLTSIVEYKSELENYREKYEKYTFMKDACSPGGGDGIQSVYVEMYMNEILSSCNFILSHMFNGTLQLGVPVIDESQFSIPFYGPGGLLVPDVSLGSTAQKCMIGLAFACAAIMKSSDRGFIIPRFDEIDGGLDENNRISFITVIDNILNIMNAEQCIMCSHNTEFDYTNTSRIICTQTGFNIQI